MALQTGFLHLVYFFPRVGIDAAEAASEAKLLAQGCREHLSSIPSVLRLEVGFPAGTPRDVVDNSYAVGILVEFADAAGYEVYEVHPDHLRFIAECKRYWSRVQVYDTSIGTNPS